MNPNEQLLQFYIKQSNMISNRIENLYQNLDELRSRISNLYDKKKEDDKNNDDKNNDDNKKEDDNKKDNININNWQNLNTTKCDIHSKPSVSLNDFFYSVKKKDIGDNSLNPFDSAE